MTGEAVASMVAVAGSLSPEQEAAEGWATKVVPMVAWVTVVEIPAETRPGLEAAVVVGTRVAGGVGNEERVTGAEHLAVARLAVGEKVGVAMVAGVMAEVVREAVQEAATKVAVAMEVVETVVRARMRKQGW